MTTVFRKEAELAAQHPEGGPAVPRPDWGGYRWLSRFYLLTVNDEVEDVFHPRVEPHMVEFWQGQSTRIHDRIRFVGAPGPESVSLLLLMPLGHVSIPSPALMNSDPLLCSCLGSGGARRERRWTRP